MGLFDSLKNAVQSELNHATKQAVNNAVHNAANNITNATKSQSTTNALNTNSGGSIGKGKRKEENWGILYVKSSGADAERPVKLRKKPSTGQWFLNDIQCLADMRIPVAEDPWA